VGTSLSTSTGVFDSGSGTPRINYVGSDSHVHQLWIQNQSSWEDFDLTEATSGPLVAAGSPVAALNPYQLSGPVIAYIGADSHIHQFSIQFGGWHDTDLTAGATGAPNTAEDTTLSGYYNPLSGYPTFLYVATDSHVHQLTSSIYESGADLDLTAAASALNPLSSTSFSGFFDSASNTLRVSYVASDSHLHQFWSTSSTPWDDFDLTAATGAPKPASATAISSFFDSTGNTPRINYVGSDSHLHQFWIFEQAAWEDFDLTAATGAPKVIAAQPLNSFVDQTGDTPRINYVGADYHVHQFWIFNNAAWKDFDLTIATGSADVAVNNKILSGFIDSESNTPRINYEGNDSHIHQFWIANQAAWYDFDLNAATGSPDPK
jgi:hypothetical protein